MHQTTHVPANTTAALANEPRCILHSKEVKSHLQENKTEETNRHCLILNFATWFMIHNFSDAVEQINYKILANEWDTHLLNEKQFSINR